MTQDEIERIFFDVDHGNRDGPTGRELRALCDMALKAAVPEDSQTVRRWRNTKVTVPCDGDNVLGYWCPKGLGGVFDCDVVHYYSGRWHEPDNDEDDYSPPDFWMPLPDAPSLPQSHAKKGDNDVG